MPTERPFLTEPQESGQHPASEAPPALFDLAVNRAAAALRGTGTPAALEAWHARTRFARRVPLADIRRALDQRPRGGEWHWQGGKAGSWQPGKAAFP